MRPVALAVLLAGCSAPLAGPETEVRSYFPHPEGFSRGEVHGPLATSEHLGPACADCHGGQDGAPSGVSCATEGCHRGSYPHVEGWRQGTLHGASFRQPDGSERCATLCHGVDLGGGLSGVGCGDCHAGFPHGATWKAPARHGVWVVERGTRAACVRCHAQPDGCRTCHPDYPHADGWATREGHATREPASCKGCHGRDLAGGPSTVPCTRCHSTFPHRPRWADEHRGHVRVYGDLECAGECHAAEGAPHGQPTRPRCTQSCHRADGGAQ